MTTCGDGKSRGGLFCDAERSGDPVDESGSGWRMGRDSVEIQLPRLFRASPELHVTQNIATIMKLMTRS